MTTPENPDPTSAPPPQYGDYNASPYGSPPAYGEAGYGTTPGTAYASWIARVGGYLIDEFVILVPYVVLLLVAASIGGGAAVVIRVLLWLASLAFGLWNGVFRIGNTGQSIGMSAVNIRLIRQSDGHVVGPGMAFVRGLAHILDLFSCLVGFLWPLWDSKRQTFADKVCSTVVVRV